MLYTEQASLHHNEWGNVVMHKLGHWYLEKGLFCIKIYNWISTISNRNRHPVDQNHRVSREYVVCWVGIKSMFSSLKTSEQFKFRLLKNFGFKSECTVSNKVDLSAYLRADSPATQRPSCAQDFHHFYTPLMQKWHQFVCCIIVLHCDESESFVHHSPMRGTSDMQRMQSD